MSNTFISTINESRMEEVIDPTVPMDVRSTFFQKPTDNLKSKRKTLGTGVNCTGHSRVFVLWRPWVACSRCIREIEHGTVTLPDDGDWTCPHVQAAEYEKQLNLCLAGDGLIQTQEYFNLQDGARCVHLVWLELDPSTVKTKKAETAKIFTHMHSELIDEKVREEEELIEAARKSEEYEEEETE